MLFRSVLDLYPKLEYFKMSEAESLKGQFKGFTREQQTERLNQFIDVILHCDLQEASISVPNDKYREILYPILHKYHASPYYFAFIAMVSAHAAINRHSGSDESMDFFSINRREWIRKPDGCTIGSRCTSLSGSLGG